MPVNYLTIVTPHVPGLREIQYSMIPTTPTARATTKTLRYSLDQARVVAVATTAITTVLATHRDCSARLLLPPGVLYFLRVGRWSRPISSNLVASATGTVA